MVNVFQTSALEESAVWPETRLTKRTDAIQWPWLLEPIHWYLSKLFFISLSLYRSIYSQCCVLSNIERILSNMRSQILKAEFYEGLLEFSKLELSVIIIMTVLWWRWSLFATNISRTNLFITNALKCTDKNAYWYCQSCLQFDRSNLIFILKPHEGMVSPTCIL